MGPEPPQCCPKLSASHLQNTKAFADVPPRLLRLTGLPARPQHCRPAAVRRWRSYSAPHHRRGARPRCACCRLCTAASCGPRPTPVAPAAFCSAQNATPVWMSRREVFTQMSSRASRHQRLRMGRGEQIEDAPGGSLYPSCRDVGKRNRSQAAKLLLCLVARCTNPAWSRVERTSPRTPPGHPCH